MEGMTSVMTPEQVARYLQVSPPTIYRYIRQGKLAASRLGRAYRITRDSVDRLLLVTRASPSTPVRRYTAQQLRAFVQDDRIDSATAATVDRFIASAEARQQ